MKVKIYCPVCMISFLHGEQPRSGEEIVCTVCGAVLLAEVQGSEIKAERIGGDPALEISRRAENYARLRGYTFNEDRELVLEGLVEKHNLYGDFYCPCRFDNIPENICPCLETRRGAVRKEGHCY